MKSKFLIPVIALFVGALLFGTTYSAWVSTESKNASQVVEPEVTPWEYDHDIDFARIDNISASSYLTPSAETELFSSSMEAVRLTNTAGTQSKAHTFDIRFDREYYLREIKFHKIEFDYYQAKKRQQSTKGYPKAQLLSGTSTKGNQLGGGTTINERATFISTDINGGDWWHLEFFITAFAPTTVAHGDSPVSENTKLNGIRITDDYIYDYQSNGETITAFVVIDNLRLSTAPTSRLGLFNKTTGVKVGGYYWIKVAFAGVLEESRWDEENDVTMTYAPEGIVRQDRTSFATLFYIEGLQAGTVVVTVTVRTADGEVRSISTDTLTVTNP